MLRIEDLKLASAVSPTLSLAFESPLAVSTTFAPLIDLRGVQRMMGTHGLKVTVVPTTLRYCS